MADGWHRWAAHRDGWFLVPHGEMLARVGSVEHEFKRTEEDRR
jgi:hypothetical protein